MSVYREILTKAIVAKGNAKLEDEQSVEISENISRALGCWIINHQCDILKENNKLYIIGQYEAHIWYGYDDDTNSKLITKIFTFKNEIKYLFNDKNNAQLDDFNEIKKYVIKLPTCVELKSENNNLIFKVLREYSIDIVGETKLTIKVDEDKNDDINGINPNYIVDKKDKTA